MKNLNQRVQKTILIADDNDGIVASLTMVLEYGGYKVSSIMTGEEVKNIGMPFPDLILLDIWMGSVNGLDLCRHLKGREDTKNIPVIMISAHPDSHEAAAGAGATDFIEKPYTMDTMLTTVGRHLKMNELTPV